MFGKLEKAAQALSDCFVGLASPQRAVVREALAEIDRGHAVVLERPTGEGTQVQLPGLKGLVVETGVVHYGPADCFDHVRIMDPEKRLRPEQAATDAGGLVFESFGFSAFRFDEAVQKLKHPAKDD